MLRSDRRKRQRVLKSTISAGKLIHTFTNTTSKKWYLIFVQVWFTYFKCRKREIVRSNMWRVSDREVHLSTILLLNTNFLTLSLLLFFNDLLEWHLLPLICSCQRYWDVCDFQTAEWEFGIEKLYLKVCIQISIFPVVNVWCQLYY